MMKFLLLALLLGCTAPQERPAQGPTAAAAPEVPAVVPPSNPALSSALRSWCEETEQEFKRYGWGKSRCEEFTWHHVRNSHQGRALPWMVFGSEENLEKKNVTLIMCGVHGDEITPIKFCYDILYDLKDYHWDLTERLIVVAPIVSPDSFFKSRPTRTNANGVDVNRNFPTKDWSADALRLWRQRHGSDKRRYPGKKALSEPEVVFQVNLIKRYRPSKIISVHSPLMMLDYDGPELQHADSVSAKDLLLSMSEKASGYKVSNYPHFPGSLGNWAGKELGIPTYTLELPNSDPHQSQRFWHLFREAIHHAIEEKLAPRSVVDAEKSSDAKRPL